VTGAASKLGWLGSVTRREGRAPVLALLYSKYRYFVEDARTWMLLARSPETSYLLFALPDPGGPERP